MKVLTTGVFDILHSGHINILTKAAKLGNTLTVGIQDDVSAFKFKGKYPVLTANERKAQLSSLPFVNEVYIYEGIDQIPYLERCKPNIMVQGSDWEDSIDRSEIKQFLKENNINLVLVEYTQGISTSDIIERAGRRNIRRDVNLIFDSLDLLKIEDLKHYEMPDPGRTKKLACKIKESKVFVNPVSVTQEKILIDGYNRVAALLDLGIEYVPVQIFDYRDVYLDGNIHFIQNTKTVRLSEFDAQEGRRIVFPPYSKRLIIDIAMSPDSFVPSGATWHRLPFSIIKVNVPLEILVSGKGFDEFKDSLINDRQIRYYPSNIYDCSD